MLVINHAVNIPYLQNHVLCLLQMHLNGVTVNEVPKFLSRRLDETTHALSVIDPMDNGSTLIIPLCLKGIVSYLTVHKSTIAECENEENYPHIE